MKRYFLLIGVLLSAALVLSSFSLRENLQDPPKGKKKKRHMKLVKIDEDGNRVKLDTVLTGDDIFVWNGDTIGGKQMKLIPEGHFETDSVFKTMKIDLEINDNGEERVLVMNPGGENFTKICEVVTVGDSAKEYKVKIIADDLHGGHDVMFWDDNKGKKMVFPTPKIRSVPQVAPVPNFNLFEEGDRKNIIDLGDPAIISYKKKKMKDGREKITIIRSEPDEGNN